MRTPRILTSENFQTEQIPSIDPFCRSLSDWVDVLFEGTPFHAAMGRESLAGIEELIGRPSIMEDIDHLIEKHGLTKREVLKIWNSAIERVFATG